MIGRQWFTWSPEEAASGQADHFYRALAPARTCFASIQVIDWCVRPAELPAVVLCHSSRRVRPGLPAICICRRYRVCWRRACCRAAPTMSASLRTETTGAVVQRWAGGLVSCTCAHRRCGRACRGRLFLLGGWVQGGCHHGALPQRRVGTARCSGPAGKWCKRRAPRRSPSAVQRVLLLLLPPNTTPAPCVYRGTCRFWPALATGACPLATWWHTAPRMLYRRSLCTRCRPACRACEVGQLVSCYGPNVPAKGGSAFLECCPAALCLAVRALSPPCRLLVRSVQKHGTPSRAVVLLHLCRQRQPVLKSSTATGPR